MRWRRRGEMMPLDRHGRSMGIQKASSWTCPGKILSLHVSMFLSLLKVAALFHDLGFEGLSKNEFPRNYWPASFSGKPLEVDDLFIGIKTPGKQIQNNAGHFLKEGQPTDQLAILLFLSFRLFAPRIVRPTDRPTDRLGCHALPALRLYELSSKACC